MKNLAIYLSVFGLFLLFAFQQSSSAEEPAQNGVVRGNVICLLPDHDKGTVKPVIATEPCNGKEAHAHVIIDTRSKVGNVYAVNGSPEAIQRLEKNPKKDIDVKGKFSGSDQTGWIITVE
ncbi:MAG: hypothetical protein ACRENO_00265 [Thermodesulfobacteriota bacterium]